MPRTPHRSLNARSPAPMRVPPDQSATAPAARASAASGSRDDSSRVMRVSRVPSANASTRPRPTTAAWRNRRSARAYGSIEPDTSHSSTMRRGRSDGSRRSWRTSSPPERIEARTVRRRSGLPRDRDDGAERRDRRRAPASRRSAISRRASANSAWE